MDDSMRRVDVQKLMSLADDLAAVLKNNKDNDILMQVCTAAKMLHSSCEEEFREVHDSLGEYQKKVDICKQKIIEVENDMIGDVELENLQKELDNEVKRERSLRQELSEIKDEISDMDRQRTALEEKKATMKGKDKGLVKSQHLLSLLASVTRIVPDLDDQTNISGYIVDKDKKRYERFDFEPTSSPLDVCNRLWERVEQ